VCVIEAGEERRVSRRAVFNTWTTRGATSVHALAAHRRLTYWQMRKSRTRGIASLAARTNALSATPLHKALLEAATENTCGAAPCPSAGPDQCQECKHQSASSSQLP